jgi:hypothetical protein
MSEATGPVRRPAPPMHPALTLAILSIAAVIVFVLGVAMGARGYDIAILGLALITGFLGAMPLVVDQARPIEKRQQLIALIVLVYTLFLVTPVFTQHFLIAEDAHVMGSVRLANIDPSDIVNGQIAALVGLVFLLLGFYLPFGRLAATLMPKPRRDWSHDAALAVALIMLPLGWAVYLGGQFGLIPMRAGSGFLGAIVTSIFYGISLLTLVWLRDRSRIALLLLLLIVPVSMGFNFFTGSKRLFLTPAFMVVLAYMVWERRIRRNWAIAGFAVLVLLYPVSQFYRKVVQQNYELKSVDVLSDPGKLAGQLSGFASTVEPLKYLRSGLEASGARLDGLGILCVIVRDTPEKVPYQKGWTLGYIFVSFIPRVLWPGKPGMTIGEWVYQSYAAEGTTDVAPTWMGELYFNFGWLGIVIGMFVMGTMFRVLQELLFRYAAPIPAMLAAIVVVYSARAPTAAVMAFVNGVAFTVPFIVLAHFLVQAFMPIPRKARKFTDPDGSVREHGMSATP